MADICELELEDVHSQAARAQLCDAALECDLEMPNLGPRGFDTASAGSGSHNCELEFPSCDLELPDDSRQKPSQRVGVSIKFDVMSS